MCAARISPAVAYTDGSVKSKGGGWAWVSQNKTGSGHLATKDAYDAELMAVCQVCEQAEGQIAIVCDHEGIVKEIEDLISNRQWEPPKKAKDTWQRIEAVAYKIDGVKWLKRNSTHEQRLADKLAGEAASVRRG